MNLFGSPSSILSRSTSDQFLRRDTIKVLIDRSSSTHTFPPTATTINVVVSSPLPESCTPGSRSILPVHNWPHFPAGLLPKVSFLSVQLCSRFRVRDRTRSMRGKGFFHFALGHPSSPRSAVPLCRSHEILVLFLPEALTIRRRNTPLPLLFFPCNVAIDFSSSQMK